MQVCCSHELATVPYIPVPGILFDKYNTNVSGVMQCWYFGNYPSLMSKAAGELSFTDNFSDKESFLEHLAGIYFGNSNTQSAVKAWKLFEEGYKNYPTNILFSYYGPAHDGVVWELQLKPKNYSLSRSWLYKDAANGDRIGECLFDCHTADETITLLGLIESYWEKQTCCTCLFDRWTESITECYSILAKEFGCTNGFGSAYASRIYQIHGRQIE